MKNNFKSRRNIPTELKRKVLIEAGYKCAIPTCGNSDVDLHHIIPFEKCNNHEYENLIALCPNCHRKTDKGKIDRKALLFYKARLQKILSNDFNLIDDSLNWKTIKIIEDVEGNPYYSFQIEYPKFNSRSKISINEINTVMEGLIFKHIHRLRSIMYEETDNEFVIGTTLAISFEVISYTQEFCSVRLSIYQYSSGAAHGNHYSESLNFSLNPVTEIKLGDMFSDAESAKEIISDYCRKDLALQIGLKNNIPNQWIIRGTNPKSNSFDTFNITRDSIYFSFDEYCVASFADGAFVVKLPLKRLSAYLNNKMLKNLMLFT